MHGIRRPDFAAIGMRAILTALLLTLSSGCAAPTPVRTSTQAAASSPRSTHTETIPGSLVTFELVSIPPSGSLAPFWIGKTEVTWQEYGIWAFALAEDADDDDDADAESSPSEPYLPPDRGWGHQGYPAIGMTHHAAQMYCQWLSAKTGGKYRLPTPAEWEHACRAGAIEPAKLTRARLGASAWFAANADDKTHPVAKKQPNAWGLHDMLGNAAEWCAGAEGKSIACGGSFRDRRTQVHCGARLAQTDAWSATDPMIPKSIWWLSDASFVGFRLVREP